MRKVSFPLAVFLTAFLGACRIEVIVPSKGTVSTLSGSVNCLAESTCTQDVADIHFDETYVANPDSDYDFLAWKSGFSRLCGGKTGPCQYSTAILEGNEDAIAFLDDQSQVLYVEPVFVSKGAEPEELLGATLDCPWDESDPTLHVFLAAGQSEMVAAYGRPGTLPAKYETGTDQLQMWDEGSWKRLGLSTENGNHGPRYGPELAFAWTLHAACPDSNIGIIKYAVGGSPISTWAGGENSDVLVANVRAAFQAHPDITFEGFLYKQGAADARNRTSAEAWGDNFLSIVDGWRNAGAVIPDDLPFLVASTRGQGNSFPDDITDFDPDSIPSPDPGRPFILHVIHQQWMVQFERPGIYPVVTRDIPKGEDGTHATPEGIRTVGRKFAEVYLKDAN